MVLIIVISALGGEDDTPKVSNDEQIVPVIAEKEPVSEIKEIQEFFGPGETIETKKVKAIITDIEKPKGNDFNKPADGNEFVLLNLMVENVSDREVNISSMLSFDAYVDDNAMNESFSAQIAKEGSKTVDGTIAAGKKITGALGYEVPKDWEQIEIHFSPDAFGSTTIKWIIKNE